MTGHIEKRGDRNYLVVIEAGEDAQGKRLRHFHRVRGTKRAAEALLTSKLAEAQAGRYAAPSSITVAEWMTRWLNGTARMRVTPKTLESYQGWVDGRINPLLGHYRLDALTAVVIQAAWADLMTAERKDRRGGKGLSPKTIRNCHGILRAALTTAIKHGLLARNPCDLADLPRAQRQEMRALDAAQINTLLEAARGRRLYIPVLLSVTVGLRRGETLALRWSDIDLDGRILTVARSLEETKEGLRMKEPKSGKVRKINIPPFLVEELRRHRETQRRVQGLVVCNEDGSPVRPGALTMEFWSFIKNVEGVPPIRFHDLRHNTATLLLSLGIPLPVVSEILGHADSAVTARVYAHVLPASREAAATAMETALRRAQGG